MDRPNKFSVFARILHWLIALHMIGLIVLGWWMVQLSFYSGWYYTAPHLHKAFGIVVFVCGLLLLVQRLVGSRPAHLASHTGFERAASAFVHAILMICVLAIPVSGYIMTTSNGEGVSFFNLFDVPSWFPVTEQLRDRAINFHYYASYGLMFVVALHAGGALKHHFIDRDETLKRMVR